MVDTCDRYVLIEEQRARYMRYRNIATGRRWEVLGECVYRGEGVGPCTEGSVGLPLGPPEGRLDVPVTPELKCELCVDSGALTFNELIPANGRVVVAAVRSDCPASLALTMERLAPETWLVGHSPFAYGELLVRLWRDGQGFCLVEHDVVPWPGALAELWACPEPWCGFCYMLGKGHLGAGIGCVRFSEDLVRGHPELCEGWQHVPWYALDGRVNASLLTLGFDDFHVHEPPVGHAPVYAEE